MILPELERNPAPVLVLDRLYNVGPCLSHRQLSRQRSKQGQQTLDQRSLWSILTFKEEEAGDKRLTLDKQLFWEEHKFQI